MFLSLNSVNTMKTFRENSTAQTPFYCSTSLQQHNVRAQYIYCYSVVAVSSPDVAIVSLVPFQIPFSTNFNQLLVPNAGWGFAIGKN